MEDETRSDNKKKAKKTGWIKWGAMAACLCLVIAAFSVPHILKSIQDGKNMADGNITTDDTATKITFEAKVLEVQDNALLMEPLSGTQERKLAESILINTEDLAELNTIEYVSRAQVGDIVRVGYLKEYTDLSIGKISVYEIAPLEKQTE